MTADTGDEAAFLAALAEAAPVWRRVAGARAAARLAEMATTLGAVWLAKGLVVGDLGWSGFMALSLAGRLDASVEALLLRPAFGKLFDEGDRRRARARLAHLGYTAPWDTPAALR